MKKRFEFLKAQVSRKVILTMIIMLFLMAIPSALASISWPPTPSGNFIGGKIMNVLWPDNENNNIGIGTGIPTERLDIVGTGTRVILTGNSANGTGAGCTPAQEKVFLDPTGIEVGYTIDGQTVASVGSNYICTDSNAISWTNGSEKWWKNPATESVFDENGHLGINTISPAQSLDVNGNAVIRGDGSGTSTAVEVASGNVGIGTANASAKLDVVGTTELNGNTDVIGNFNVNGNAGGTSGWATSSDLRLKENIEPVEGLDKILQLQGVRFNWKDSGKPAIGVIAQDVEKVFPEVIKTKNDETGMKSVDYAALVAPLIEAVKELKAEHDDLQGQITELEQKISE